MKRPPLASRVERLVGRYALPPEAGGQIAVLLEALSSAEAPTTVHDPAQALEVHIADSLVALTLAELRGAGVIADLGSGAGLPALALALARPDARVVAVESGGRKGDFIEATAQRMGLGNVEVVRERAEEWRDGIGAVDVVCARALAALPVLVEYAAPLLRMGGALVAWKGAVAPEEAADGAIAAAATGLEALPVAAVDPYAGSERRTLHRYVKAAETPARYPRRAGMATKRPLSAKNQR